MAGANLVLVKGWHSVGEMAMTQTKDELSDGSGSVRREVI